MGRCRVRSVVALGSALGMLVVAGPASAASEVTSGWWTSAPVALAPDAGEDQLLVHGGPGAEEPLAYAGISFVLDDGEIPGSLTLSVAEGSASTPAATLALCALDAPATAASGEPAEGAPAPDCTTEVEASPATDGTSYTFDLAAFAAEGTLDVAVVPTQQTDRVVLDAPTIAALAPASPGPAGGNVDVGTPDEPAPVTSPPAAAGSSSSVGSGGGFTAPRTSPATPIPSAPSPSASTAGRTSGGGDEVAASPQAPAPFEPVSSTGGTSEGGGGVLPPLLFAGLAATAAVLWNLAGREPDGSVVPGPAQG